jgi:hypothetical protein
MHQHKNEGEIALTLPKSQQRSLASSPDQQHSPTHMRSLPGDDLQRPSSGHNKESMVPEIKDSGYHNRASSHHAHPHSHSSRSSRLESDGEAAFVDAKADNLHVVSGHHMRKNNDNTLPMQSASVDSDSSQFRPIELVLEPAPMSSKRSSGRQKLVGK